MPTLLERVERGDIITAEQWNRLVDAVNELILASSSANQVSIAAVIPAGTVAEPIRLGTLLQITGQNFGFTAGRTRVTFDGPSSSVEVTRMQLLPGSSDTRLLLTVPTLSDLGQGGAQRTLRVDNGVSQDIRTVFVAPVVITLQGDVFVDWRADVPNPLPNPIQAGDNAQPTEFKYRLRTGTNMPASFDLSVNVTSDTFTLPDSLLSTLEFREEDGSVIANRRLQLGMSESRNIVLRVPPLPAAAAEQTFTLSVTATAGSVTNTDRRSFTVGANIPASDPTIIVEQTGIRVSNPTTGEEDPTFTNGRLEGDLIRIRAGWRMRLFYNVSFTQSGGVYDMTVQPKEGTTLPGWTVALINTPAPITGPTMAQVGVLAAPGAASGVIVVRVKRRGATSDLSKEYRVQLLP